LDEALTVAGKAKALRMIDCHPRLATLQFDALPVLVQRKLDRLWKEHETIEINP